MSDKWEDVSHKCESCNTLVHESFTQLIDGALICDTCKENILESINE